MDGQTDRQTNVAGNVEEKESPPAITGQTFNFIHKSSDFPLLLGRR